MRSSLTFSPTSESEKLRHRKGPSLWEAALFLFWFLEALCGLLRDEVALARTWWRKRRCERLARRLTA